MIYSLLHVLPSYDFSLSLQYVCRRILTPIQFNHLCEQFNNLESIDAWDRNLFSTTLETLRRFVTLYLFHKVSDQKSSSEHSYSKNSMKYAVLNARYFYFLHILYLIILAVHLTEA